MESRVLFCSLKCSLVLFCRGKNTYFWEWNRKLVDIMNDALLQKSIARHGGFSLCSERDAGLLTPKIN